MTKKSPTRSGTKCRVTFEVPPQVGATESVHLVGDFNDWSTDATALERRKDGRYSATLTLETGRSYRYRYLVDGEQWENDWQADEYVPNDFGGDDSVVRL